MIALSVLILFMQLAISNGDYFIAVDNMEKLRAVELQLINIFNSSLSVAQNDIYHMRRFLERVKEEHVKARENIEKYVSNPINAYLLIKRMTSDWVHLKEGLTEMSAGKMLSAEMTELRNETNLPSVADVVGAAKGIRRMQTYYNLSTADLTEGIINGTDYGVALDWSQCFEIAKEIYADDNFHIAKEWFLVALKKLEGSQDQDKEIIYLKYKTAMLEYLALINYELGMKDEAFRYIEDILSKYPEHPIKDTKSYILLNENSDLSEEVNETYTEHCRLCQGIQNPDPELRTLYCKLSTKSQPYFVLAPLKVEILKKDPQVVLYHNILNDKQIEQILEEASTKHNFRSEVTGDDPEEIISDVRVSRQAWLPYTSSIMRHVRKIVSYINGLTLENIEDMQVVSYGIGGQYDPHHDNLKNTFDEYDDDMGDRLATNMFYLSDVEQGGYTAFPKINIFTRPSKGGLIVWYNLLRRLDADERTLHGGCPILKGIKRIGNIWVHTKSEEFSRPCVLDRNSSVQDIHLI